MEKDMFATDGLPAPQATPKVKRKRSENYRQEDYRLFLLHIMDQVEIRDGYPVIEPAILSEPPVDLIPFSKTSTTKNYNLCPQFYENDSAFIRVVRHPEKYVERFKKFPYMIGTDISQKVGMPSIQREFNSWTNKLLTAYYQSQGIIVIPNVTWSTPDSFRYAFYGLPKHSVIAINSTGIVGKHASKYLWYKGYEEALKVLEPTLILRYGDVLPFEDKSISVYYTNHNLENLRNGR